MTSLRSGIQRALLGAYATANRRGWLDSRVAEVVFQRGYFAYKRLVEDPFAKLIAARPELFRGGHVIDVGANIGYTATLFAGVLDASHQVHAFEPEHRNFKWLERAIARTGTGGKVVAHHAAVGARDGTIELWHNAEHHADHRIATDAQLAARAEVQTVQVIAVDSYVASLSWPAIAFVKIDVQGYEHEVLRGMHETVARNPRIHVAVELCPDALEDLGYDPNAFVEDLRSLLPHTAVLDRSGRLHDADAAGIARAIEASGVGYVDLVCANTRS